ncbi:hypothetical protein ABZP36_034530 [Zizania latifolia]
MGTLPRQGIRPGIPHGWGRGASSERGACFAPSVEPWYSTSSASGRGGTVARYPSICGDCQEPPAPPHLLSLVSSSTRLRPPSHPRQPSVASALLLASTLLHPPPPASASPLPSPAAAIPQAAGLLATPRRRPYSSTLIAQQFQPALSSRHAHSATTSPSVPHTDRAPVPPPTGDRTSRTPMLSSPSAPRTGRAPVPPLTSNRAFPSDAFPRKRRLWRQQLESIPPVVLALNDDEKKPDNAAEFPTIVALARDKSFCSMNGNGMLAAEVKAGSQVLKLRTQMPFGKWIEQHQASSGSTNPAKRSSRKMKKHKLLDLLNEDDGRRDTVQDTPDIGPTVKLATTSQMEAAVVALSRKLSKLLTGRASPGMEEEACCKFGLTLYTLGRLYKAVELHTRETGEWSRGEEIFDLVAIKQPVVLALTWSDVNEE